MVRALRTRTPAAHAQLKPRSRGFTLIEMLVVTAIIVIISSALLVSNRAFGGTIILRSLAYDVALSIREAQTYGISVRQSAVGKFDSAYGVEVRLLTNNEYDLYQDTTVNGHYDAGASPTELVTKYLLQAGYHVSDICYANTISGAETCGASSVSINFIRPEPAACIGVNDTPVLSQSGSASPKCIPSAEKANACIVLTSPNGSTVDVVVDVTGQISVKSTCTD